jgi:hypothetical protein
VKLWWRKAEIVWRETVDFSQARGIVIPSERGATTA